MSGGVVLMMASAYAFNTSTTRIYTSGAAQTETPPIGAYNCLIECFGGGGGGGPANALHAGGGGGGGAYSSCTVVVKGNFTYSVGTAGTGGIGVDGGIGGDSIISGAALTTITCHGGGTGGTAQASIDGHSGLGGTATDANSGATNTNGNNGITQGGGGVGGAGITGGLAGDGSPYGGGGNGAAPGAGNGLVGHAGAVVFKYT